MTALVKIAAWCERLLGNVLARLAESAEKSLTKYGYPQ